MQMSLFLAVAAAIVFSSNACLADVFHLKNGGAVRGELLEGSTPEFYLVRSDLGGKIKIAKAQVDRVVEKSDAEKKYETFLPKVEDTVKSHMAVAMWCQENSLRKQRQFHLEQVIRLDPEHEDARHGLGYSRVSHRWVRKDEWSRKQGYVRYRGSWRLPQEVAMEEVQRKFDEAEAAWLKKLRVWNRWIDKARHDEAIANIEAITDPAAASALVQLLKQEDRIHMKQTYVKALGRLQSPIALTPLMEMAIEEENRRVRDLCLDQLENNGNQAAASYFLRQLKRNQGSTYDRNIKLNRIGLALGRVNAQEAVLPLIDALVTEHIVAPGSNDPGLGRLSLGFGNAGGGSFQAGGSSKPTKREFRNEGVLYGLKAITNADFRYDKERWKQWLVEQNTPEDTNLRRDG